MEYENNTEFEEVAPWEDPEILALQDKNETVPEIVDNRVYISTKEIEEAYPHLYKMGRVTNQWTGAVEEKIFFHTNELPKNIGWQHYDLKRAERKAEELAKKRAENPHLTHIADMYILTSYPAKPGDDPYKHVSVVKHGSGTATHTIKGGFGIDNVQLPVPYGKYPMALMFWISNYCISNNTNEIVFPPIKDLMIECGCASFRKERQQYEVHPKDRKVFVEQMLYLFSAQHKWEYFKEYIDCDDRTVIDPQKLVFNFTDEKIFFFDEYHHLEKLVISDAFFAHMKAHYTLIEMRHVINLTKGKKGTLALNFLVFASKIYSAQKNSVRHPHQEMKKQDWYYHTYDDLIEHLGSSFKEGRFLKRQLIKNGIFDYINSDPTILFYIEQGKEVNVADEVPCEARNINSFYVKDKAANNYVYQPTLPDKPIQKKKVG